MDDFKIKNISLAEQGKEKIEWASSRMKVLSLLREMGKKEKPFNGITIAACLHVTSETANLMIALKESGAGVYLAPSNPLSTQDDVAAALVKFYEIPVFAIRGENRQSYYENLREVASRKPHITLDDGGDLTAYIHENGLFEEILGGTEETTTGVIRFRAMERDKALKYPIIAVNDSRTKYLFDNRYGTGQSTIDGILRATNILIAGLRFVVAGYGWCGRGIAMRARGMGANVIITEVNPIRALEARMDGFEVLPMEEAARIGDVFVTATGCKNVIDEKHFYLLKNGAILANSGHFDVEINVRKIREIAVSQRKIRDNVEEFILENGKKIYLLAEGRLVNLGAAEGHPPEVMDLSFANQYLAAKFILENRKKLENRVYVLPPEIDEEIAKLKLKSLGITIDELSDEQIRYLRSWREGT